MPKQIKRSRNKYLLRAINVTLLSLISQLGFAAGYRMEFQSASVLGDAGEAAVVEDAGTNWYNSAGLVYLPQQFVASAIDVYAPVEFRGTVVAPSPFGPPFGFAQTGTATSHPNSFIPAFHYSMPLTCDKRYAVGISVTPAWGFTEDYGNGSMVRYLLTRVKTKTIDVAPSFAFKISPQWSIGIGPDINYFSVQSRSYNYTQGPLVFGGTVNDSTSRFSADHWGYGGHIGILYRMNDHTRFGLNYRSKIMMNLKGDSQFALNNGPLFESFNFKLPIPLPPSTTFSIYHDFTPCFALMGTVAFDEWSVLKDYHARNVVTPLGTIPNVVIEQRMSNTVDVSVGAHYQLLDQLMLRGSIKYEPTPTQNAFRNINFPDARKLGFQIGGRYYYNNKLAFDVLYGHVFTNTVTINDLNPISLATAKGRSTTKIDLLGAQLVWTL